MRKFSIADLKNKHVLSLAGNGFIAVFGLLTIALLTRSLEKADLGIWFFFLTINGLGDAIRGGFLGTAAIKFYAGTEPQRAQTVLGSVWFLALALTGILLAADAVGFLFLHQVTSPELAVSIKWFGITFLSSLPFNLIYWILVADEKYDQLLWLRLVNSGSMIAVIGALILAKQMSLTTLLWCNLLTNCLTSAVGMLWGSAKISSIAKRSKASVMELVDFGKFSLATTVTSKLFSSTDTFIITFMLGPSALAIYNLPVKLMEIVEFPLRSFVGTGMSAMAVAYNNNNISHTSHILKKYSGMLTLAFIPFTLLAFCFADVAIALLGGAKYAGTEAANVYRLLMLVALAYPIDRFIGVTLDIIHKPRINFYKVLIMLAVAVTGDYIGILIFKNVYGIAFASFFTVFAGVLFGYICLRKYLPFSLSEVAATGYNEMRDFFKKIAARGN